MGALRRLLVLSVLALSAHAFNTGTVRLNGQPICCTSRLPPILASAAAPHPDDESAADAIDSDSQLAAILQSRRIDSGSQIETSAEVLLDAGHVWALLFNPGGDEEGIYSRRLGHTGQNLVLTFEEEDDAERYANMLVATDFPTASTVQVESRSLVEFCDEGGHLLGLVRRGSLIMPPEDSVDSFDWSPDSQLEADESEPSMAPEELDASRRSLEAMFGLTSDEE